MGTMTLIERALTLVGAITVGLMCGAALGIFFKPALRRRRAAVSDNTGEGRTFPLAVGGGERPAA
jgi:hypothetical protein